MLSYGLLFPRAEKLTKKALDVTTGEKRLHVLTLVFLPTVFDALMLRVSKLALERFNVLQLTKITFYNAGINC